MNTNNTKTRRIPRRLRWLATASLGLLLTGAPGLADAQDDFIAGSGNAYAQVLRVGPTAARLSLAPVFGLSLADYLNTEGRGEATVADWAALGVSEPALPDNTPTLRVESSEANSEKGKTQIVAGSKDGSGNGGGLMELYARATKAPLGESHFRLQSFAVPGLIEFSGGEATTSSGIVTTAAGKLRESRAVVTIDGVSLADTVKLKALRWEAIQRSTNDGKRSATGSFTVGGASVGPTDIPLPIGGSDISTVLGPLNTALAPTGFAIVPPSFDKEGGVAGVSPLSFQIVNSPLGRQFLGPILEAAQPIRQPLADAIISGSGGEAAVGILVADLTLGVFSGSSQLHIELGGANAYTEGQRFVSPFGPGQFRPPPVGPETVFVPGRAGQPAIPGTKAPATQTGELVSALPPGQRTIPGDKGGVAVAVGLVGLAVALGLAGADWYRMRVSRRAAA